MIFQLSCEEVGAIHVSVDGDNHDKLIDFLEQDMGVAVENIY